MSLSLANMLDRVKRRVPTTTHDTELQDALLERMNYLSSLDIFPFQEKYQYATLPSGEYSIATPNNFGIVKDLVIWATDDEEANIDLIDSTSFSQIYPKPDERTADRPSIACFRVAEGEIWFNCPADADYTLRMEFYYIPDDAMDTTVTQLTELAKLCLIDWASADGERLLGNHDRADAWESQGDKKLIAIERRYQRALERGGRFISPQLAHALKTG